MLSCWANNPPLFFLLFLRRLRLLYSFFLYVRVYHLLTSWPRPIAHCAMAARQPGGQQTPGATRLKAKNTNVPLIFPARSERFVLAFGFLAGARGKGGGLSTSSSSPLLRCHVGKRGHVTGPLPLASRIPHGDRSPRCWTVGWVTWLSTGPESDRTLHLHLEHGAKAKGEKKRKEKKRTAR